MVLPPSPADPDADAVWLQRIVARLNRTEGTLLQLAVARDVALLPELVDAMPEGARVVSEVHELRDLPEGAALVLLAERIPPRWLNANRPWFAALRLKCVIWATEAQAIALARDAPDFFDWISHREDVPDALASDVVQTLEAFLRDGGLLHVAPHDEKVPAWLREHLSGWDVVDERSHYRNLRAFLDYHREGVICETSLEPAIFLTRRVWWAYLEAHPQRMVFVGPLCPPGGTSTTRQPVDELSAPAKADWGLPWALELGTATPDWNRCAQGAVALGDHQAALTWIIADQSTPTSVVDHSMLPLPLLWRPLPTDGGETRKARQERLMAMLERGRWTQAQREVEGLRAFGSLMAHPEVALFHGLLDPRWVSALAELSALFRLLERSPSSGPGLSQTTSIVGAGRSPSLGRTFFSAKLAEKEMREGRFDAAQQALDQAYAALPGQPWEDGQRAVLDRIQTDLRLSQGGEPDPAVMQRSLDFWAANEPDHPEVEQWARIRRARPPMPPDDEPPSGT